MVYLYEINCRTVTDLLNILQKIPVFRIDPCYYDVTDLDELFEYDTD
jgi:hypothetical protein